jgi:DNA-binding MarR family transcriptional regulator
MLSLCAVLCYARAEAPHDNRGQWVIGRCENPLVDLPYRDQLGAGTGQETFLRPQQVFESQAGFFAGDTGLFIGRNPDCSINELLQIMRITKQYLHQPLKKLLDLGYVRQKTDVADRRIRRLRLSAKGRKLEFELSEVQRRRFADIFKQAGPAAEKHWRQVMALLSEEIEF